MAVLTPARNGDECGGGWQDPGPRFGIVECVLDPLESGDEAALVQAAELAERCGSRLVLTGATRELNVWSSAHPFVPVCWPAITVGDYESALAALADQVPANVPLTVRLIRRATAIAALETEAPRGVTRVVASSLLPRRGLLHRLKEQAGRLGRRP
jgi:hypothetical protein